MSERPDTLECRRLAETPAYRELRPIVDPELDVVRVDCTRCRAQDGDPMELYRPARLIVRGQRRILICDTCGELR